MELEHSGIGILHITNKYSYTKQPTSLPLYVDIDQVLSKESDTNL
jgi:hypothetical protein